MLESLGGFFRLSINFGWFLTLWCQEGRLKILVNVLVQLSGMALSVSEIMTQCLCLENWRLWLNRLCWFWIPFCSLKFLTSAFKRKVVLVLAGKEATSLLKIYEYGFIVYIVYGELLMKHELTLVRTCLFWGSEWSIGGKTVWLLQLQWTQVNYILAKFKGCRWSVGFLPLDRPRKIQQTSEWVSRYLCDPFSRMDYLLKNHKNNLILGCGWWLLMLCSLQ